MGRSDGKMNTSSFKNLLIQKYHDQLRSLIPYEYQKNVSEVVLSKLDKVVAVLAEERNFTILVDSFAMQRCWLRSTGALTADFMDLSTLPCISKTVKEVYDGESGDFRNEMSVIAAILGKQGYANSIRVELRKKKEDIIRDLYWDIFRDEDHHNPAVKGSLLQQLSSEVANIPWTTAYELITKHNQLCELFPEFGDKELEAEFTKMRLDFLADKNPSQMDDFNPKIIQAVQQVISSESADHLGPETKNAIQTTLEKARGEKFIE